MDSNPRSRADSLGPRSPQASGTPSVVETAQALEDPDTIEGKNVVSPPPLKPERSGMTDESNDEDEDELPNGGYGWIIMLCLVGLNACTWGINTTYGVFSSYFLEFNYYSASQLDYAWVGGLSAAMAVLMGPPANWMVRRFGFKVPLYIGAAGVGLGQCLAGICTTFGPFLACQGILFGIGMGLILVPSQPLLAHWFDRRLSLAQGIGQAGSGVGALIFSNTTPLLLKHVGVKWTYIINGCISMAVLFPAAFLMKGRHKAVKAKSAPLQLNFFWHPGYKYLLIWAFLTMMGYFIAIYTLASYCTNGLGLTQTQGGAVQSILAAGQIIGRPMWGYLLDRGGRTNMVIVSYIIAGIATLAAWMPGRSFGVMAFYGLVNGMTAGTIHAASTPLSASVVGVPDLASALSIYWIVLSIPNALGGAFAIMLVDYSRKHLGRSGPDAYQISIGFCGGLYFAGAIVLLGVKHYLQHDWKIMKRA